MMLVLLLSFSDMVANSPFSLDCLSLSTFWTVGAKFLYFHCPFSQCLQNKHEGV